MPAVVAEAEFCTNHLSYQAMVVVPEISTVKINRFPPRILLMTALVGYYWPWPVAVVEPIPMVPAEDRMAKTEIAEKMVQEATTPLKLETREEVMEMEAARPEGPKKRPSGTASEKLTTRALTPKKSIAR